MFPALAALAESPSAFALFQYLVGQRSEPPAPIEYADLALAADAVRETLDDPVAASAFASSIRPPTS